MGQDLLLHSNYLFVQPLMKAKNIQNKAKKYENVILLVLDPLNGGIEKAKFQWETPRCSKITKLVQFLTKYLQYELLHLPQMLKINGF